MVIPNRGFRFFRRAAHRVESEKHRSPTLVGGLRRGRVSDLAFHVKRFTRIHLAPAQQVSKEEGMVARSQRKLKQLEHPPCALAAKRVFDRRSDAPTRTFPLMTTKNPADDR